MVGGGEFSGRRNFFSLSNSLNEFFFRPLHEYFLGLIGVHEFFSFNFLLREYFFLYFARPPSPISFLKVRHAIYYDSVKYNRDILLLSHTFIVYVPTGF